MMIANEEKIRSLVVESIADTILKEGKTCVQLGNCHTVYPPPAYVSGFIKCYRQINRAVRPMFARWKQS